MDIKTLESFKLSDAVKFHDKLNPKLWRGSRLDPAVSLQLKAIADDFLMELGIKNLDVADITISGSNAAYTYTPHSDLDLHILVDMSKLPNDEIYRELFNAKKTIYNDSHDIKIKGIPIELYVQDSNEPVVSLGEYSILNDKWLKLPTKRRANLDQTAAKAKYEKLYDIVQRALRSKDSSIIDKTLKKIKQYRKAGLDTSGEFGPENLAFKAIRSQGLLTKLYALRDKLHSERLSIEGMYSQNEDYHPNAKPRGPEFKPTMPAGTVKVDVSDVYDWYKLGQHISDLEGFGKHDFGKGPPSTILSFGDEDTEHKYIDDLMKTGLTTTDIDPKGHEPKKGQKVDPRYNVGEGGAETSWSDGDEKITLQDILELTKHIKQINLPINDNLKSKLLHWDGNPEEIERINQVTVSNQFPILVMIDEQGQIDWILDGNHRLHKAIRSQAKTIPAKLIKPSDLSDKAKRVFHIKEQGVTEAFDQPYKLKWEKGEFGDIDAYTILPDGSPLSIMFNKEDNGLWMAEFYRSNTQDVTGEGDAQKIFATVLHAINQFIKKVKPKQITFSAVKENDPTGSRSSLYDRLVQRYASNLGYSVERHAASNKVSYDLIRQGKLKEASGYIPSEKEKNDPRFKTALTVDVHPSTMKKDSKRFGNKITRAGIPPTLNPSGKI